MGKKTIEKPDWFDLKKYNFLSECSAEEWIIQLSARSYLLFCFTRDEKIDIHCSQFDEIYSEITTNPNLKYKKDPDFPDIEGLELFDKFQKKHIPLEKDYRVLFQDTIAPLTFETAYYAILEMPEHLVKPLGTLEELYAPDHDTVIPLDYRHFFIHENIRGNIINASIDLDAPDSVLIRDFKTHIKEARELYNCEEGKKIKNNSTILSNLFIYKIIQCLDLMIWEKTTGNSITNTTYAKWLFPDDENADQEKIRKTVKPLAERSIQFSFIQTLGKLTEE